MTDADVAGLLGKLDGLRAEIGKVIVGQRATVDELLTAFLAGGHALLEGVPGLAKTLLIRTLAEAVQLSFRRIQFTPDLMPTDILGTEVLEEDHATGRRFFKFTRGPVFANIVLADEINRTPPKTQAALLEAMQEQAGTYPLPEAQLDRFLLHIRVDYPDEAEERDILARTTAGAPARVSPVITGDDVLGAQALVRDIRLSDALLDYTTRLVRASRPGHTSLAAVRELVRWGAGPRAGQALVLCAKARALLQGRFAVTLEDLRAVAPPVLRHRVLVNFRAEAEGVTADQVTERLLVEVTPPASPLR